MMKMDNKNTHARAKPTFSYTSKKFIRNNKGESHIVASLLLVAIVLAASIVMYNWVMSMVYSLTPQTSVHGEGITGSVTYSTDQSTWSSILSPASVDVAWYTKLTVNGGQHSGAKITIDWQLQRKVNDTTWNKVGSSRTTTMRLDVNSQDVYATPTGVPTDNHDWSSEVTEQGTYHVVATMNLQ